MRLVCLFLLTACSPTVEGDAIDSGDLSTDTSGGTCRGSTGDPYTLTDATIEDDQINLFVAYGGGCETHDFDLCWMGDFSDDDPMQAELELWHDAHGDSCEAAIQETQTFDLTALRAAWSDETGLTTGTIDVLVNGQPVSYSF